MRLARLMCLAIIVLACGNWTHGLQCGVTKNINTDFGAVGSGLVNDGPAFVGAGSFLDFAINTFQPANPGKTICLAWNSGNTYFMGTFVDAIFDGVTNLVLSGNGATFTNALNVSAISGAAGQPVLTLSSIPPGIQVGHFVIDDSNKTALDGTLTVQSINAGANQITLNGNISAPGVTAGDIITIKGVGGGFGTQEPTLDAAHMATVSTVAAGATSVTLTDPTQVSKFAANRWAAMAGLDQQGGGSPINQYFHEFVFITAINGVSGQITFQSPLKFGYKSTWPNDQGGPAALWAMPAGWNVTQVYNNTVTFGWDGPGDTLLNARGRSITFNNCSFPGNFGPNISENQTIIFNNCNMPNISRFEVDKLWEVATFNGGTINGFEFFSGTANDTFTLNGTNVTQAILGSPGTLNIVNSTLTGLKPGAEANGITSSISCSNSNLGTGGIFDWAGVNDQQISAANGVTINTSGLMTIPRSVDLPVRWAVPGADVFLGNADTFLGLPFSVTDVSGDATNTYVQTTLTGFSSLPGSAVTAAPAKTINFVNCTGSSSVLDWSQAGAQNARPGTYTNRIYTCTNGIAAQQALHPGVPVIDLNNPPSTDPRLTRALSSLTVAVSQAEAGAAVNWQLGGQFNNGKVYDSSNVGSTWAPIISLNTSGTRTYTGSTNTWSASLTGDTLSTTIPGFPSYIGGTFAFAPFTSRSVSGESAGSCPIVTLTIQTSDLLQRDLAPAANDNRPAFLDQAA